MRQQEVNQYIYPPAKCPSKAQSYEIVYSRHARRQTQSRSALTLSGAHCMSGGPRKHLGIRLWPPHDRGLASVSQLRGGTGLTRTEHRAIRQSSHYPQSSQANDPSSESMGQIPFPFLFSFSGCCTKQAASRCCCCCSSVICLCPAVAHQGRRKLVPAAKVKSYTAQLHRGQARSVMHERLRDARVKGPAWIDD